MCLPIWLKGCGLREAVNRRYGQFMGAHVQNITPLIDRTDTEMNAVKGRLYIPPITTLLGEGSFNHPVEHPWATLIEQSNQSCNLATGLQYAWSHLTSTLHAVADPALQVDEGLLFNQEIKMAGFYHHGSITSSVTKQLGLRIKKLRSRDHYEQWSWDACTNMIAVFLHSSPDHFGIWRI